MNIVMPKRFTIDEYHRLIELDKADRNIKKHGVLFQEAATVF
jgi:uncharacterized DUF497 family protein